MMQFRYSILALACTAALSPSLAMAEESTAEMPERITVYGRQNHVVMNSGLATKSDMSLMETPAAVVVVDEELIRAQGANDLQELIRNVSGLTQAGNNYGIGDNLQIRGLGANYTYDGMYGGAGLGNTFNPTRSMTNVESVEVLKGPATGLYGMGSAGGVINLIEKKPEFESNHEIDVELGAWDTYSLGLDSTGGLSDSLAYRIVAKSARSDGFRDIGTDRDEIYASLKKLIGDDQDLMFSVAYIDDSIGVDSIGHPIRIYNAASTGGKAPEDVTWEDLINDPNGKGLQLTDEQRKALAESLSAGDGAEPMDLGDTSLMSPMSQDNKGEELRFKLTHNINFTPNLFLNQQLQYRDYDTGFVRQTGAYNYVYWNRRGTINADPRAPLVEDGVIYPYAARRQEYRKVEADESSWQYFADLRYDFTLGDLDNEILVNANYEDREIRFKQHSIYDADKVITDKEGNQIYQGQLPYIYDIRNPNWPTGNFDDYDPLMTQNYNKNVSAWGVGIQHVAYFDWGLTTRIGVAFNEIEQRYQHLGVDPRYSSSRAEPKPEEDTKDNGTTYNLGLTYMPTDNLSIFVNHSKGRTAYSILGSVSGDDSDRKDAESISNDLGIRYKAFDDQLLASLVVFETSRTNLRYTHPLWDETDPIVDQYVYDGEEETKGVELDVNAHINEQWKVNVNAMYQDARDKKDPTGSTYDQPQKGVPKVAARAWVTYSSDWFALPSVIDWSLGVTYEDERSTHSASFGIPDGHVPAYTKVDLGASYDMGDWRLQVNLNNVFDEEYYEKAMFLGGMPGKERNLSLNFAYRL